MLGDETAAQVCDHAVIVNGERTLPAEVNRRSLHSASLRSG
jgi:hypothetical protein